VAPKVTAETLAPALLQARTALAAPIVLRNGAASWSLPPRRIARLLELPSGGATRVAVAGTGAERYLGSLAAEIDRKPADATFAVEPGGIRVVPAVTGRALDVPATARAIQAAAFSPNSRSADLVVREPCSRSTRPPGSATPRRASRRRR
jgi:vancomycin resistance protein YoaR